MFPKACRLKFPSATYVFLKHWWPILLSGIFFALPCSAQSRRDLEEKRKSLLKEINRTGEELLTAQKNKKATLQVVVTLQRQIRSRQQLVQNMEQEIARLDQDIRLNQYTLHTLEKDIQQLRTEHAKMLRLALRQKLSYSPLLFLLSSSSINNAFRRWQYLRQYDRHRTRQAMLILETETDLRNKMSALNHDRSLKETARAALVEQKKQLDNEFGKKDALLKSLKANEKKLVSELTRQEEQRKQLDLAIENIIRKELSANRRQDRTEEKPSADPEAARESTTFGFSKGRLPWPVSNGSIVRPYGTQQHPRYKEVKTQNNGIDIRADGSNSVRAVAAGRVSGIQVVPGYQNTLILQHGEYYSVYSNLSEVLVKRKDQVQEGQEIGKLDPSAMELHFELWREKSRLNPEPWIKK